MNRFSFVVFSFILFHSAFCQMDSISSIGKYFLNKETVKVLNLNGRLDLLLSDQIAELNNLEELNVSGTNLEVLPESITKCKKLKKVNLSYNPSININQVCNILKSMDITWLSLEGYQLSFIPFQVAEIQNLIYLNVSNNLIDELPDNFGKLVNLVELDLAMNQIDSVNFGLNTLPRLKTIYFSYNPKNVMDHLISSRFDFPALEELKLQGVRNFL